MTDQPTAATSTSWFARARTQGVVKAAEASWDQVKQGSQIWKDSSKGLRGVAFARVGGTAVGLGIAAHALKDKTSDGEDRGMLARMVDVVVGGGIVASSVLAGR